VNTVSIKAKKKSKPEPIPANHLFPVKRRKKTEEKNREKAIDMKTAHTPNY